MDTRSSLYLKQAVLSCAFAGCLVTAAMADGPAARLEMPPAESVVSRPGPRLIESQTGDHGDRRGGSGSSSSSVPDASALTQANDAHKQAVQQWQAAYNE